MTAAKSARAKPKPPSATATQILDLAETLIQTRSYSAFSYQDIADALGIRKASIHYHFPSKTDLGVAVVTRYTDRLAAALAAIVRDESESTAALLDFYVTPYAQFGDTPDRVCLCGALAGEMLALPAEMRACVERFFKFHQAWLAKILERGAARGEIALSAPAAKVARMVFAALQGALLVKRTTADAAQLDDVVLALKAQLSLCGVGRGTRAPSRRR